MKKKNIMKHTLLLSGVVFLLFASFSCNSPNEPVNSITLSVEAASTEAWLNIKISNISLPKRLEIIRNNEPVISLIISSNDTTIYDEGLLPNKTYAYQAKIIDEKTLITSDKISVTTLDTTSHNFSWQTFTLGDAVAGSSVLYDVAIVNDTLAYAVGEIYMKDSFGQPDPQPYNLAKWNGHTWQLFKIQFYTFCGQEHRGSYRANAVAILNDTTVWVASNNSQIAVWNGDKQTGIMCLPVSVSKMWAANKNDIYTVGALGQIGHYTNGSWQKIESGTTLNINDIFGAFDNTTNKYVILTVAANIFESLDRDLLLINGNSVIRLSTKPIYGTLRTVWFVSNKQYYVGGGGIYQKHTLNEQLWKNEPLQITRFSTNRIRGNNINDIATTGGGGELLHYNGNSWKSYIEQTGVSGNYYGLDFKENIIIAVGENTPKAAITIGRRK